MSHDDQENLKDATTKRSQYLRRKSVAVLAVGTAGALTIVGALIAAGTMVSLLFMLNYIPYGLFNNDVHGLETRLFATIFVLITALAINFIARPICRDCIRSSREIEYVPPVREQIAALRAEEILLRGSSVPSASPAELLRAACEVTKTAPDELLRPTKHDPRSKL